MVDKLIHRLARENPVGKRIMPSLLRLPETCSDQEFGHSNPGLTSVHAGLDAGKNLRSNLHGATMQQLARQVRLLETAGRQMHSGRISSGSEVIDRHLPDGGYSKGTLVEFLQNGPGSGASSLALITARQAMASGKYFVVVDPSRRFYPPAAVAFGLSLERIIVVHPSDKADTIWAFDQSLRSQAVGAVWAAIDQFDDRQARRLQLAAEQGGGLGLLIRDESKMRGQPSWADIQWRIASRPAPSDVVNTNFQSTNCRWIDLHLLRCRGGAGGKQIPILIDGTDGQIHDAKRFHPNTPFQKSPLATELAQPTTLPVPRSATA